MNFINELFKRSKTLTWLGFFFLALSIVLVLWIPVNTQEVLGLNSIIKPLKFSISLWVYSWTMAYIVHYYKNEKIKKRLIFLIVFVMLFEQLVITVQAFRGTLSHFNTETTLEIILFNFMGVLIMVVTGYSLYAVIKFWKQEDSLPKTLKASIYYGTIIFVIAGFMGGVMGAILSHNVGGEMGNQGLPLLNWSTKYGDIRVPHFIGIHALQIIPLFGFAILKKIGNDAKALKYVQWLSFFYFLFVMGTFFQSLMGLPFIKL